MKGSLVSALVLGLAPSLVCAQTVDLTRSKPIAPLAGQMSTPAWYQTDIGFWGTDMSFAFKHKDALWFAFGDTVMGPSGQPIQSPAGTTQPGNDALGAICLAPSAYCPAFVPWFTTGDDVDNYIAAHPPGAGELNWEAEGPPVIFHTYTQGSTTKVLPISVLNGGTTPRNMLGRTPGPGFSNYKNGSQAGAFVVFNGPLARCSWPCPSGFTCPTGSGCPTGFQCDSTLGVLKDQTYSATDGGYELCESTTPPADCHAGVCVDPNGPLKVFGVKHPVMRMEVGNADSATPSRFLTKSWLTHKMQVSAYTTVNNFDKSRSISGTFKNDYRPPLGLPTSSQKVFMWGRPGVGPFGTAGAYFAYVDMPLYSATGNFTWRPQYFTGLNASGVPTFSPDESAAKLLNLSGSTPGGTDEVWTLVGLGFSVRWIEPLKKFAMIYGGGHAPLSFDPAADRDGVPPWDTLPGFNIDPKNGIHIRFADHPWGPWSPPQQFFEAGDPIVTPTGSAPATQYGQHGMLFHSECTLWHDDCAPGEQWWEAPSDHYPHTQPYGWLYAPHIIEEWTMPRTFPVPGVDIYWTVSTFAPYQVVLMRTRIKK